jgi:hypothetical protein
LLLFSLSSHRPSAYLVAMHLNSPLSVDTKPLSFIVILRGYKLPVVVLDAFLRVQGLIATLGYPRLPDKEESISTLLRAGTSPNIRAA